MGAQRRLPEMTVKIVGRIPWRVFWLSLGAAVALMGVIACGDGASSPTVAPTQSSGVDQPAETEESPSGDDQQAEASNGDPTQAAQPEAAGDPTQEAARGGRRPN